MRRSKPESDALVEFVAWVKQNIKGRERAEAQTFLDRLFRAYGHKGAIEAGAQFEDPIKRLRGEKRSTSFADLVWKPWVLVEMKARGEQLQRHTSQAFEYWKYLVPNRPRWVVLCNFDELWIYDFEIEVEEPTDRLLLDDLPIRSEVLAFLKPDHQKPVFGVNRVEVTREAAAKVAATFNSMVDDRKISREVAQRFVLQCVMALFSEDLGLLPRQHFTRILQDALESKNPGKQGYIAIGDLFRQMNSARPATSGPNKNVPYFNGGLFRVIEPVEMTKQELEYLREASMQDWSRVNPAIFGTIFQSTMDDDARHAYGAHYTAEHDILKVVRPTIVNPWRERIDKAETLKELLDAKRDLGRYRVLDPACGSGNFLYVAFRELKRLETDVLLSIRNSYKGKTAKSVLQGSVSVTQFFGFDVIPFATELAKVTLMLAKELALKEARSLLDDGQGTFDLDTGLPLENLDANIVCADALLTDWPKVDAMIGNPPFQSKNKAQEELGRDYMGLLDEKFQIPGRADFCVYFFRKAHDEMRPGTRAGLVGTNTIRQNYSRIGGLDHIVQNGGTITEAVSAQPWSGDAVVHVSIVNWIKGQAKGTKKLWFQEENEPPRFVEVEKINSALSEDVDVTQARKLHACSRPEFCAQGQTHGHEGFLVERDDALRLLRQHPEYRDVLVPFLIGDDMIGRPDRNPSRYAIDFAPRTIFDSERFADLFKRVKDAVLEKREAAAKKEEKANKDALKKNPNARVNWHHKQFFERWWCFSYPREALIQLLGGLDRYIACVRVTKRPIFEFVSSKIHPNDALQVFPFEDDYSFGILQSGLHWKWFTARCSTLKADPRYTSNTVFDTFPWPQQSTLNDVKKVAKAAVALRELRAELRACCKIKGGADVGRQSGSRPAASGRGEWSPVFHIG